MKLRRTALALSLPVLLAAGGTGASALAPAESPLAPSSASAADFPANPDPEVVVSRADGVDGAAIEEALEGIDARRGEFTQAAVAQAFERAGGGLNVVMMNLSQGHDYLGLENVRLYANVKYGEIRFGLWIAEAGTFRNTGDGGFDNWAFHGFFDRPDSGTVQFRRP